MTSLQYPFSLPLAAASHKAGLALLRVAPFIGATVSVTFTISEDIFIRPLAPHEPELRRHTNRILPSHGRWLWPGLGIIGVSYGLSLATAAANVAHRDASVDLHGPRMSQRVAAGFYLAGLVFSAAHFLWGYRAMYLLRQIRVDDNKDDDDKADNVSFMRAWLGVNWWRGALADFPSWVCYFVAYMAATW